MDSYWKGEKSLTKTFWFLWVFGSLAMAVTLSLFAYLLRFIIPFPTTELSLVVFLFLILFNPYYIFCWVAVWRSTKNSANQLLQLSVKVIIVSHILSIVYGIYGIGEHAKNVI